jgi:hypothetical protein
LISQNTSDVTVKSAVLSRHTREDWSSVPNQSEPTLLECPRCLNTIGWYRDVTPAPGTCTKCHSRQYWNVVKQRRAPGYVRVMSHLGSQVLKGPHFQEDPKAWVHDTRQEKN